MAALRPYDVAAPAPDLDLAAYLGTNVYYAACAVGLFLAALACVLILSLLRETDDLFPELEAWAGIVRVRRRGLITYDWRVRLLLWWRRLKGRTAREWTRWRERQEEKRPERWVRPETARRLEREERLRQARRPATFEPTRWRVRRGA